MGGKKSQDAEDSGFELELMGQSKADPGAIEVCDNRKPPDPVNPLIDLPKDAVAVKKKHGTATLQTVVLRTDKAFSGKGKFTCDSDCVIFSRNGEEIPLRGNKTEREFTAIGGGITLQIRGVKHSTLKGVHLTWALEPGDVPIGPAATAAMTAVEATLDIFTKAGVALGDDDKNGDGRVVHKQNVAKTLSRAKLTVTCAPAAWAGTVILDRIKDNVQLFDAAADGSEITPLPKEIAVGPGKGPFVYWVQGQTESGAKADTGFLLKIKDLADDADRAKVTVIKTELRIYSYKTSASKPDKLGDEAKKNPGAVLHKFARAALAVAQVVPKDCPCTLVVKVKNDKVALYDADRAGNDVALPLNLASGDIADEGKSWWVEGAKVSGGDKDTGFTLDVKDVDDASDSVAITVKEIKITPKQAEYTVVLSKTGTIPVAHPCLKFDIDGPPGWIVDVQLQRDASDKLTAGPGLADGWLSTATREDRPGKTVFSSFTTGDRTAFDGGGKATFEMPLDWWKDQARRKRSDFQAATIHYRLVVVPDEAGSSIGYSSKNGVAPASLQIHNNLVGLVLTDSGYSVDAAARTAQHDVEWYFEVREAGSTDMYTVVQWNRGETKYCPGPIYAINQDYDEYHRSNIPEWAIDRLRKNPRYRDGVYDVSLDGKRATADDAPNLPLPIPLTKAYLNLDFQTRVHLNFEVPDQVNKISRREGSAPYWDILIGVLDDPQPFELDRKDWSAKILYDGTTMTPNPGAFPGC